MQKAKDVLLARETADRLQLALSAGRLGDWSWDATSDLVTFGPVAAAIFGVPADAVTKSAELRQRLHPQDREPDRRVLSDALASHSDYTMEYRVGDERRFRWVASRGRGLYAADGRPLGMIGVLHDITERKEAEEIRQRLAAVVESSDDAIISMGLDAILTTWNQGAARMFGYTPEEVIGRSVTILLPPGAEDEEPKILQRIIDGERVDHYETVRARKDGSLVNVSLTVSPIHDTSGKIIGVSKISRDITDRKRAEEALRKAEAELRRHTEKLEEQVAERTARLRETIQELEAFSYSVSHDLRSPLRAMQGYSDALLDDYTGKLDEVGQDYLKRIRRAASRMDLLIQDVLAYSRVAKGDIQLHNVDVANVIHDVLHNYPNLQSDRVTVNVQPHIPPVFGHEAYLTQIVSNYLNNAVKFVQPGVKAVINITAAEEGDWVRLNFEDNGIGIAPEHQKQIFQIFGRVYSEKKFEGTGIGLAIAKKAAERMGGSVGVHSQFGQGSTFFVLLKRAT